MDGDYDFVNINLSGLDLNRDSTADRPTQAETSIEWRIRRLEAVTARARQRQRWRQSRNAAETRNSLDETPALVRRALERGKGYKRDSSHLVAKALEMDSEVTKPDNEDSRSFYDCNICLEVAKDPVLTCCGHLFCWPCFYQVSNVDSSSKECPVCKGEVLDSSVTPIYGNSGSEGIRVMESDLRIPPRPKASRVEGVRQQRVTQQSLLSHVPVAEELRQIRIRIGAMGLAESTDEDNRIHQVLSESAESLSSLSSALSNAERLVEDLETVITYRTLGNEGVIRPDLTVGPMGPTSHSVVMRRSIMWGNVDLESLHLRGTRRRRLN